MKKVYLFLLASLFTQGLFAQEIHYSESVPVEEIRVALQHAKGGYVDEIYDEIEYLPLETTKESTIQNIKRLWVTDQYFIILDVFGSQILFFDKQGKYVRKINKIPNCEPCKAIDLLFTDATIDVENKSIYVSTSAPVDGYYRIKFDFDGNYFGTQAQLNELNDFIFIKNSLVYYNSPRDLQEERNFTMLSILGNDKDIISYDSLASVNDDEYLDNSRSFSVSSSQDSIHYFTRPYDYNVYAFGISGLKKIYNFIFPLQYALPNDFITNKGYNGKREKMLEEENTSWIMTLDYIRRHKSYLIFNAKSFNTSNPSQFAYNLSTGTLLDFEKVTPNNFNNNYPLGSDMNEYILASDDDYMYKSIMPVILLHTAQDMKFTYANDPDGKMKKIISGLTNFSNPVLVRLKIKSDL